METRIMSGRPFGGTGFVWSKTLSSAVKLRGEYRHERVTVLQIDAKIGTILLINVYMPYFNTNDTVSQTSLYMDTLAIVASIMNDNPHAKFILMGDMNCNIFSRNNLFSDLLIDFINDQNLHCVYELMQEFDTDVSYTRCNVKQNSFSLLDYFFVSRGLIPYINNIEIVDSVLNLSDHLPVKLSIDIDIVTVPVINTIMPTVVDWKNVNGNVRTNYENVMDDCLNGLIIPDIVHGDHVCNNPSHLIAIEQYYCDILNCVKTADLQLPRCTPTTRKGYWNNELSMLKNDSIVAYDFWKLSNCPKNGPIFEAKKRAHYRYKSLLRRCQSKDDQKRTDDLNRDLLQGDHHKFWKSYKYFNYSKSGHSTQINGLNNDVDIANCFAANFKNIYESRDAGQSSRLKNEFDTLYSDYCDIHSDDSIKSMFLTWPEMLTVMSNLKTNKASASFLKAEHLLYGSPRIVYHLHILINAMIQHGYVAHEFLNGLITPLIKDSEGDHSSPDNYRGLTLGVTFSFLFEHALLLKIGSFLKTDSLQFGYKKRHSTSHALYTLRTCVDYFNERGSNVFAAFLDCTKGFDKINHNGMFVKLIKRGIPLCVLNILIYWYSNLTSIVRWNNALSDSFDVLSGVRQGGVLSPYLFSVYIDDLIIALRNLKIGCHIIDIFIACIVYADDICLLAPSRSALQLLLTTCENYGFTWCLSYNPLKSKVMIFGKSRHVAPLHMYGNDLEIVDEYKYLGVKVIAGTIFSVSNFNPLLKFRCAANTILNVQNKSSEVVLLKMLYAACVPNLTYSCEAICYNSRQFGAMDVALNDAIRRIFGYDRWESVRHLRSTHGYPSLTEIFSRRSKNFTEQLRTIDNATLRALILVI